MSFARDLVALSEEFRAGAGTPDLFGPDADAWLASSAAAAPAIATLGRASSPEKALKAVLQALAIQREGFEPRLLDAAFVATFPGVFPFGARPTELVIPEMLTQARQEIVTLGYEVTHGDTIDLLRECSRRGVRITLICDRGTFNPGLLRGWPDANLPEIYVDREREEAFKYSKMHCKTLLIDNEDLLVTSANFTLHGLRGNIEFGVRLRGGPALQAHEILRHLISSGLVEKVQWAP